MNNGRFSSKTTALFGIALLGVFAGLVTVSCSGNKQSDTQEVATDSTFLQTSSTGVLSTNSVPDSTIPPLPDESASMDILYNDVINVFDRSLGFLASYGVEEDLSFVDTRQGPNVIQMLDRTYDPILDIEEVPDVGVETASLVYSSLRVLMWNPSTSSWVRLCTHTGCVVTLESVGTGAGKIPLGSTYNALTTEPFCFAFHTGGLTAYLGAAELANKSGIISQSLGQACGEKVTSEPTGVYHLLGNTEPVTDVSW